MWSILFSICSICFLEKFTNTVQRTQAHTLSIHLVHKHQAFNVSIKEDNYGQYVLQYGLH